MRASEVRRIAAVWARPDTCAEVLARTGAITPGCSSELAALLTEVQARGVYTDQEEHDLGRLWEWTERTGPRPAQNGWLRDEPRYGCPCGGGSLHHLCGSA